MDIPKSKVISLLCIVYGLFAMAGVYVAVLGYYSKPEPLPLIEETVSRTEQIEQAKRITELAQKQQPDHTVLDMFYKGWLLEYDYKDLKKYKEPMYEGDSFEKRLMSYNDTVKHIPQIYQDAVTALTVLSVGSLGFIIFMLLKPCYFSSLLLAAFPLLVLFICALFNINPDPLEYCWIPFTGLGGLIFILQLIFSFRFGDRPAHRTVDGLHALMLYRRGLLMLNLGIFMLAAALVMGSGSISGSMHSGRVRLGLAIFGEEGIVIVGFIVGIILVIPGLYYMLKKTSDEIE